uniref:AP superfamily protein n=1 Tax=Fervidobacterium pennivorans TaxID=93466 RepID=A0A7V4NF42_FERPE
MNNLSKRNLPLLVIFIDALSYSVARKIIADCVGRSEKFGHTNVYRLLPSPGYSSNLHWLLFAGKTPDEMGFFTDWNIEEDAIHFKRNTRIINGLLSKVFDENKYLNTLFRYFSRRIGFIKDNIPFSERHLFQPKDYYFFSMPNEDVIDAFGTKFRVVKGNSSDVHEAFEKALRSLRGGQHTLVVFNNLDHVGHEKGPDSPEYLNEAKNYLLGAFEILSSVSWDHVPLIVISDHGMAKVKFLVNVSEYFYREFGLPGAKYAFYCDSVYLRVWSSDSTLLKTVRKDLGSASFLREITLTERQEEGLSRRVFGDLIFVLNEGCVFDPNFFSVVLKKFPVGMHGYLDKTDETCGTLVTNLQLVTKECIDIKVSSVFKLISNKIAEISGGR